MGFCIVRTLYIPDDGTMCAQEIIDKATWAVFIVKVPGGWIAYERKSDYADTLGKT